MYLILHPAQSFSGNTTGLFESYFTSDMHRIHEALQQQNVRVFSLSALTEIKEIKVSYEEITKETRDV